MARKHKKSLTKNSKKKPVLAIGDVELKKRIEQTFGDPYITYTTIKLGDLGKL